MDWPHAPIHRLDAPGAFMVTAGTHRREVLLNTPRKLSIVRDRLFTLAQEYCWLLQAWAILGNHYHFIVLSPKDSPLLGDLIRKLHSITARELNQMDESPGRKVWFQYWDSTITFERSYFARLYYVHENPVRHGIARVADQ